MAPTHSYRNLFLNDISMFLSLKYAKEKSRHMPAFFFSKTTNIVIEKFLQIYCIFFSTFSENTVPGFLKFQHPARCETRCVAWKKKHLDKE